MRDWSAGILQFNAFGLMFSLPLFILYACHSLLGVPNSIINIALIFLIVLYAFMALSSKMKERLSVIFSQLSRWQIGCLLMAIALVSAASYEGVERNEYVILSIYLIAVALLFMALLGLVVKKQSEENGDAA